MRRPSGIAWKRVSAMARRWSRDRARTSPEGYWSVGAVVDQDAEGRHRDPYVAPDAPTRQIFEVGLQPRGEIALGIGRAAEASHLGEAGDAGAQAMALPVPRVDLPKQLFTGL